MTSTVLRIDVIILSDFAYQYCCCWSQAECILKNKNVNSRGVERLTNNVVAMKRAENILSDN